MALVIHDVSHGFLQARNSPEAIGMYDYTAGHLNLMAGAEKAAFDPKTGRNVPDTPVLIDGTVQNSTSSANASPSTPARRLAVTAAQAAATGGSWAVVGNSGAIAIHFTAHTNGQALIMQRPDGPNPNPYLQNADGSHEIAAFFDMNTYSIIPFHIQQSPFCAGHLVLPNGNGLVVGGDNVDLVDPFLTNGFPSVRIIDPFGQTNTLAPNMPTGRWYPSLLTMPDATILIMGGVQAEGGGYAGGCNSPDASINNPTYIIYNPTTNALSNDIQFQPLVTAWPINLYPFLTILPYSGSVFAITGAAVAAFTITATGWTADAAWGTPVRLPIPALYPQTAAINLLPLSAANNWAPEASQLLTLHQKI
ncbi:hypothetical protein WJX74_010970 [Apatococcus lobatus]|uniref:Glyoxal oxidase N-terminal domain-containing protein n=1 Tax=Apatococcus lobatus TaxID=904363 RepID=A0AAW1RN64_9CHLO